MIFMHVIYYAFLSFHVGCSCKEHVSITTVKPFSLVTSTRMQNCHANIHTHIMEEGKPKDYYLIAKRLICIYISDFCNRLF